MNYHPYIKRILDICFSMAALLFFSPLLIPVAILIRRDSTGPPFFVQIRIGRWMRPFKLYKFRSMTSPASNQQAQFDPGDSCRVTRLGFLLRKTKIDELPELFNILKGDMSIIGPRPEVPKYVEIYPEKFKRILCVRPGLSDLASIKYRDEELILSKQIDPERFYIETILPDKLGLAEKYVDSISFNTDMKIIFGTIRRIIRK